MTNGASEKIYAFFGDLKKIFLFSDFLLESKAEIWHILSSSDK